jgi:hypothetical protein
MIRRHNGKKRSIERKNKEMMVKEEGGRRMRGPAARKDLDDTATQLGERPK